MTTHTLYRFFDSRRLLLYVGITARPPKRFAQHRSDKWWWEQVASIELEQFETLKKVRAAEFSAILVERPLYNVVHNSRAGDPEAQAKDEDAYRREMLRKEIAEDEQADRFGYSDDLVPVFNFVDADVAPIGDFEWAPLAEMYS